MKITVVCDVLGESNNGTTIAAFNLINYLRKKGHEVRILCADADKKGQDGYFVVPTLNLGIFNGYVAKNGVTLAKADKTVIESAIDGVDVVHVMLPFFLGQATAKIAKERGVPLSAGFHLLAENFSTHIFMAKVGVVNRLTYVYFHKMYKRCDCIHYVTQHVRNLYEKMYGKTKGYVISNGVNEVFRPAHKSSDDGLIRILYTGRYSKEKSHKVLIAAVDKSKYRDKIQLILAGEGPLKETLVKQAERLPVKPVFGFFSREEMVTVDNSADLYVHAAEYEAEGIGCLEAIACGVVPIICNSERSATRFYALDDRSLFKRGSPADLAGKIDWWIEHPRERAEYSERYARLSREKFDHEACMEAMEKMLAETADLRKKTAFRTKSAVNKTRVK